MTSSAAACMWSSNSHTSFARHLTARTIPRLQGLDKIENRQKYPEQYTTWQSNPAHFIIDDHAPVRCACCACCAVHACLGDIRLLWKLWTALAGLPSSHPHSCFDFRPCSRLSPQQVRELWYRASLAWREVLGVGSSSGNGAGSGSSAGQADGATLVVAHNAGKGRCCWAYAPFSIACHGPCRWVRAACRALHSARSLALRCSVHHPSNRPASLA